MRLRTHSVFKALCMIVAVSTPALAAEVRPFDAQAFAAAQRAGRPILVDVYADWCPTCKAQAPIVDRLVKDPSAAKMIVFRLNFDEQKPDWLRLGVRRQSTLIAFRGRKETARLVGDTNPASIAALIRSAIR